MIPQNVSYSNLIIIVFNFLAFGKEEKKYLKSQLKCVGETRRRESCEEYSKDKDCANERLVEQRCFRWFLCPHEYNDIERRYL